MLREYTSPTKATIQKTKKIIEKIMGYKGAIKTEGFSDKNVVVTSSKRIPVFTLSLKQNNMHDIISKMAAKVATIHQVEFYNSNHDESDESDVNETNHRVYHALGKHF